MTTDHYFPCVHGRYPDEPCAECAKDCNAAPTSEPEARQSETPRVDAQPYRFVNSEGEFINKDFARTLERELAAVTDERDKLKIERDGALHSTECWELMHAKAQAELAEETLCREEEMASRIDLAREIGAPDSTINAIAGHFNSLKAALAEAKKYADRLRQTVFFFAAVIKSGESWSAICEEHLNASRKEQP